MLLFGAGMLMSLLFLSCQREMSDIDEDNSGKQKLSVYLTDGPYDYDKVFIDIRQVAVKIDTCRRNNDNDDHWGRPGCDEDHDDRRGCEIWDTLDINPGIYDLLTLRNGTDTLLASSFILNGKIQRIKFTIGDNNSLVVDGNTFPLRLVNNQHYVYLDVKREHLDELSDNNMRLYLDFDINSSIRYTGGQYWLKPKLKPFGRQSSGEIKGRVQPSRSYGLVRAYNATDTVYALPESQGKFKVRGLHEGTYSLFIDGTNGYQDTILNNIEVRRNRETDVQTITLHQ